jgi:hypothetical protein
MVVIEARVMDATHLELTRPMIPREAEIHWFEAHGIGQKDFKIKRVVQWATL